MNNDDQVRLKEELAKLEHLRDQRFEDVAKFNYQKMLERELKEKSEYESKAKKTAEVGFTVVRKDGTPRCRFSKPSWPNGKRHVWPRSEMKWWRARY